MTTTEPLTEREQQEQQALEQMREAQGEGSTLKDYAAKIGLDVRQLYELRRRLVRKGPSGHCRAARPGSPARKAHFYPCAWCVRHR
jgi:DNA-binding protein H-NS